MDDHRHTTPRIPRVVAVTGASGTPYAAAVVRGLPDADRPVDLVVSKAARLTMLDETGLTFREARWEADVKAFLGGDPGDMRVWADLSGGGAVILPTSPGFYAGGRDVQQLIDFVAGKVLDMIDVPHTLYTRWSGTLGTARVEARDSGALRSGVREENLDA